MDNMMFNIQEGVYSNWPCSNEVSGKDIDEYISIKPFTPCDKKKLKRKSKAEKTQGGKPASINKTGLAFQRESNAEFKKRQKRDRSNEFDKNKNSKLNDGRTREITSSKRLHAKCSKDESTVVDSPKMKRKFKQDINLKGSDPSYQCGPSGEQEGSNIKSKMRKKKYALTLSEKNEKFLDQLKGARFRTLNEKLYTLESGGAAQMFAGDGDAFAEYHRGFARQVAAWPVNPVDKIIRVIRHRSRRLVVADLGCGEAKISEQVANRTHSFDLRALNERVTECDISNVPLEDESVDIAVLCLSLMGSNCGRFVQEARRILRVGGSLLIAEVASRMESTKKFARNVELSGFTLKNTDVSNKLFVYLEFTRNQSKPQEISLSLDLKPCLYKRR